LSNTSLGLEICLSSTNFTFRGKHYKQVFGTAMCSPVSSVVANPVIWKMSKHALWKLLQTLHVCGKDMQTTLCDHEEIKVVRIFHPCEHNRERHPTHYMAQENEECFPFLVLFIKRSSNGHLLPPVYSKPTNLDRHLNYRSEATRTMSG